MKNLLYRFTLLMVGIFKYCRTSYKTAKTSDKLGGFRCIIHFDAPFM